MTSSHRQILRSSSIIGGASVVNVVIGLLRNKVAALLLGPAGVGIIGLLQNIVATASAVASLGMGNAATRQVAEAAAEDGAPGLGPLRRALFWGTAILAAVGTLALWLARGPVADALFGSRDYQTEVGWLGLAVGLTIIGLIQLAILTGLRRIGDVARVTIASAGIGSAVAVAALFAFVEAGIVPFVLAPPLVAVFAGWFYLARALPPRPSAPASARRLAPYWRAMAAFGVPVMVGGLLSTGGQLAVRAMIQNGLGAHALGYFQASWILSMTYLGFILSAMGTDYYPRLSAAVSDPPAANGLVNDQLEVVVLLAGPVLLLMIGFAPLALHLLYSAEFVVAAELLRWQIMGDVLKIVSWPLGYLLLARGRGKTYMAGEAVATAAFVAVTWFVLPAAGIAAAGIGFLAMYALYLLFLIAAARASGGFRWSPAALRGSARLAAAAVMVFLLCRFFPVAGMIGAAAGAGGLAFLGFGRLAPMIRAKL